MPGLFFDYLIITLGENMAASDRAKRAIRGSIADPQGAEEVIDALIEDVQFSDHSVNNSRTKLGANRELVLRTDEVGKSAPAGDFVGGGTGNKPIAGILCFQKYAGVPLGQVKLKIDSDVEIRTDEATNPTTEDDLGISYNLMIDLHGDGGSELAIVTITRTLGAVGGPDKYGVPPGAGASVTDFDIKAPANQMYVVLNLPSYTGPLSWPSNPITLENILVGGPDYSHGYPNAKLFSGQSTDGGHPRYEHMAALTAQIGGSGNDKRSNTAITRLVVNGKKII
jgi:hypothetical protein